MGNKKCRIYAACGVSQTPNFIIISRRELFQTKAAVRMLYMIRHLFMNLQILKNMKMHWILREIWFTMSYQGGALKL